MKQLEIPNKEQLINDNNSTEVVRFWISSGDCHVNLNLGIWADDGNDIDKELWIWSNILSDIAQHVANGLNQRYGIKIDETKEKIQNEFLKCMKSRTPGLKGE